MVKNIGKKIWKKFEKNCISYYIIPYYVTSYKIVKYNIMTHINQCCILNTTSPFRILTDLYRNRGVRGAPGYGQMYVRSIHIIGHRVERLVRENIMKIINLRS